MCVLHVSFVGRTLRLHYENLRSSKQPPQRHEEDEVRLLCQGSGLQEEWHDNGENYAREPFFEETHTEPTVESGE